MHIETIESVDFLGNPRKEDYYFFLSKTELAEMQYTTEGGMFSRLKRIAQAQDNASILKEFKALILNSYGEISPDGKHFIKVDPITKEQLCLRFQQSEAYDVLFMDLWSNPDRAMEFFIGIMPEELKKEIKKNSAEIEALKQDILPSALATE